MDLSGTGWRCMDLDGDGWKWMKMQARRASGWLNGQYLRMESWIYWDFINLEWFFFLDFTALATTCCYLLPTCCCYLPIVAAAAAAAAEERIESWSAAADIAIFFLFSFFLFLFLFRRDWSMEVSVTSTWVLFRMILKPCRMIMSPLVRPLLRIQSLLFLLVRFLPQLFFSLSLFFYLSTSQVSASGIN